MQLDFHYYGTYCAAVLAGYTHEESLAIAYSDQFVDCCSTTLLTSLKAPLSAASTQLQLEMMDARTDLVGLQDITRIWASFHFLPQNLYAVKRRCSKRYLSKYRLICGPNGDLLTETVNLARNNGSLQAAGVAMHILADTWAHRYFAGTPSLVINNTNYYFYELLGEGQDAEERQVRFRHNPAAPDDLEKGLYTNSLYQSSENAIMNLGHGRAGHLPDYSFVRYKYLPAWGDYVEIIKDNPSDYYHAFCQMIYALKVLRGVYPSFETNTYDWDAAAPYSDEIKAFFKKRQLDDSEDWKILAKKLSGQDVEDFVLEKYHDEYRSASLSGKDDTFLGQFFLATLAQKSMVTNKIYTSGNRLAGFSIDYATKGFRGIRDYRKLVTQFAQKQLLRQKEDGA